MAKQSLDVDATKEEHLAIEADTENATEYLGTRGLEVQSSGDELVYYEHQILI